MSTNPRNPHLFDPQKFNLKCITTVPHRRTCEITSGGFGVGFETLDRDMFEPEPCYPHLAELGAKWARIQSGWSKCETVKGAYDFAWLDAVVDGLLHVGVQPWMSLCFGNQLYMPDVGHVSAVGHVPLYYGDECIKAWENYVRATADHFKNRVTHFEVWNEPNIAGFWHPAKINATDYAKFVAITSKAVRGVRPDAVILGGCLAGGGFACPFLMEAFEAGMGDHLDILTYHPYRDTPELAHDSELNTLRALCDQYNPRLILWQGETGTPSVHGGHHDFLCEDASQLTQTSQAKWAIRRLMTDQKNRVAMSSYFHCADLDKSTYRHASGKPLKPVMMGLLNGVDYSPKESYFAMRNVCNLFDEDTQRIELFHAIHYNGHFTDASKLTDDRFVMDYAVAITASFERKGYPLYAYWVPGLPVKTYKAIPIQLVFYPTAKKTITQPVLIDMLRGKVYRLPDLDLTQNPGWCSTVDDLPMTDYPLVVTDFEAL